MTKRKFFAWLILSPFLILFSPFWLPSYAVAWAIVELGWLFKCTCPTVSTVCPVHGR